MVEMTEPGVSHDSYWYRHGHPPQIQIHQVTTRPPRRVPGPKLVEKDGKTMEKIMEKINEILYNSLMMVQYFREKI